LRVTDFPWPPWPARRGGPARCGGRLIANARLKFRLSHRKISLLKIPNRERIAIFNFRIAGLPNVALALPWVTGREPRIAEFPRPPWPARCGGRLIANPRLEFGLNDRKISPLKIPNRKFFAISQFPFHKT
jgi:hypothetical protein